MKLYLAHPSANRVAVRDWEVKFERATGVKLVNPFEDVEWREDTHTRVVEGDLSAIDSCDGVVAVLTNNPMMGTPMEMFYAYTERKPLIVISPYSNLWLEHPWVRTVADMVLPSFREFERWYAYEHNPGTFESHKKIGLVGRKGSGKDTVGEYLIQEQGFKRFAFADELKYIVRRLFGYTRGEIEQKPEHVRKTLQSFATEGFRSLYPNIWSTYLLNNLHNYQTVFPVRYSSVVVTDVRFPNEAAVLRDDWFTIVKVLRDTGHTDSHVSEESVDQVVPDYVIDNNGTVEDLHREVAELLERL